MNTLDVGLELDLLDGPQDGRMDVRPPTTGSQPALNLTRAAYSLFCIGVLLVLLALPARGQRGALVVQQNLGRLVDEAATIVRGHVVRAWVEPHPEFTNLHTVVVTMSVQETLKGQAGSSFTFRQFIWDIRDRYNAAGYQKGQHLLLLMSRPSQYGLSSPVGLSQGRFVILRDSLGRQLAVNGAGNGGLFRDLLPTLKSRGIRLSSEQLSLIESHRGGALPLASLEALIRQIAGTN